MNSHYILIAGKAELRTNSIIKGAYEVANDRLAKNYWPLFSGTPNRKNINAGDPCLIYLSGTEKHGMTFIAAATVLEKRNPRLFKDEYIYPSHPEYILTFKDIDIFSEPLPIKEYLDTLDLTPKNRSKWGCVLQGGCKRISQKDYATLINERTASK